MFFLFILSYNLALQKQRAMEHCTIVVKNFSLINIVVEMILSNFAARSFLVDIFAGQNLCSIEFSPRIIFIFLINRVRSVFRQILFVGEFTHLHIS